MFPSSIFIGHQLFSVRVVSIRELFLVRELYMPSLVFCLVAIIGFLFYVLSPLEPKFCIPQHRGGPRYCTDNLLLFLVVWSLALSIFI